MPILVTNPIEQPALTYNIMWIKGLHVTSADPNRPVVVTAELAKAASLQDGTIVFPPSNLPNSTGRLIISDLYARAAEDVELASIMQALMNKIKAMAEAEGVI